MTADNKKDIIKIEGWLRRVNIDVSKAQDLIDKYGLENTMKLVQEALMAPHPIAKHLDGVTRSSRNTINYFLENDITAEDIATITKTNIDTVKANMPQETASNNDVSGQIHADLINQAQASMTASPDEDKRNPLATAQGIRFDKRFSQRDETATEAETPAPSTSIPHPATYTWLDGMRDSTTLHSISENQFVSNALKNFQKGEGRIHEPYFDYKGHPTIGVGMLIYTRDSIQTEDTILKGTSLEDKQRDIALATQIINDKNATYELNGVKYNLYSGPNDTMPNITSIPGNATVTVTDSKGNTTTLTRIPNAGAKIKNVNGRPIGAIKDSEIDKLFTNRVRQDYRLVSRAVPNFDQMPENLQLAATHMCFGRPAAFSSEYKKIFGVNIGEPITPTQLATGIKNYYDKRQKNREKISQGVLKTVELALQEAKNLDCFVVSQQRLQNRIPELTIAPEKLKVQVSNLAPEALRLRRPGAEMS